MLHVQSSLDKELQVVAYEKGVSDLQASAKSAPDEADPAVGLIDFFEGNRHASKPRFSIIDAQEMSMTLAGLGSVNGQWTNEQ